MKNVLIIVTVSKILNNIFELKVFICSVTKEICVDIG